MELKTILDDHVNGLDGDELVLTGDDDFEEMDDFEGIEEEEDEEEDLPDLV